MKGEVDMEPPASPEPLELYGLTEKQLKEKALELDQELRLLRHKQRVYVLRWDWNHNGKLG